MIPTNRLLYSIRSLLPFPALVENRNSVLVAVWITLQCLLIFLLTRLSTINPIFTRLLSATSVLIGIHFSIFFSTPLALKSLILSSKIPRSFFLGRSRYLFGSHLLVQPLQPTEITFSGYTTPDRNAYLCPFIIISNVSTLLVEWAAPYSLLQI